MYYPNKLILTPQKTQNYTLILKHVHAVRDKQKIPKLDENKIENTFHKFLIFGKISHFWGRVIFSLIWEYSLELVFFGGRWA